MDNVIAECGIRNSVVIENVRISPKSLIFYNPYEGQEYKTKIVLQNIGRDAVSIRILNASSSNVEIKPILDTQFLSSGLKIIRDIKYKAIMATLISTCSIPIHINASKYLFKITVEQKKIPLRIEPQFLNFGTIDTGPSPARRRITFYNDGPLVEHFQIDLGANELNIMIEPMKGLIMAKSSMEVRVDLIIQKEGTYTSEFWIIASLPLCMQVTVTARHAHIETQSRFNMKSFQFLHFPITYFGLSSRKILLLKNASQMQSKFCITGVKEMEIFRFDEATKIDPDYHQFHVEPKEGRLFQNDVRVFTFTFVPQKKYIKEDGYCLVMMRINKVFCRDLNPDDYRGEIFETIERKPSTLSRSTTTDMENNLFDEYSDTEELVGDTSFGSTINENDQYVNVMLYGTAESPNVLITPNELVLRNLELKVPVKRVLHLKNCSKNLPIILRYDKIAFVVVEPPLIKINSGQSVEVTVTITPQSYHILKTAVKFDLLHYDQPRNNKLLQKIGEVRVPLTIHERIVSVPVKCADIYAKDYKFPKGTPKPRKEIYRRLLKEKAILGLPDDRPKALRPWKSAKICKTIYAGLPRVCNITNEFKQTEKQKSAQQNSKAYYRRFIRSNAMKKVSVKQEKSVPLREEKMVCVQVSNCNVDLGEHECANFIPLTPQQLLNITIEPRNQYIDHIVPKSLLKILLTVRNDNGIQLRIFLKPQKPQHYRMSDGSRFSVRKHESIQLSYYIYAHLIGLQNYRLDIIINECHVFETTVTVNIVQAMLLITPNELIFTPDDRTYKFIEFYNELNQDISFEWSNNDDFTLTPLEGTVQSQNKLACLIGLDGRNVQGRPSGVYDLFIKIGGKQMTYRIKVEDPEIEFLLPEYINFGLLPLGIPTIRYLPLQSCCKQPVAFRCTRFNWGPREGLDIEPMEGVLRPNIIQWIKVTAKLSVEITFYCHLRISFGDVKTYQIDIEGMGRFPKLVIDEELQFRKIAASGFDIKKFSLRNSSAVPAVVTFNVEKLSELYISEHEESKYFMKNNVQYIKPYAGTHFYIHYYPCYPEIKNFPLPMSVNGFHNHTTKKEEAHALVPRMRIHTNTFAHKIIISSWSYFFHCYDYEDTNKTITEHTITMSTTQYSRLRLCLRLDNVRPPFQFCELEGGKVIKVNEFAIVVDLHSKMTPFSFKVKFYPIVHDKYEMRIPVYIKDDYNQNVHNYLYFNGTYYRPSFSFPDETIYFGYIPLNFKIAKIVRMKLNYHRPQCHVSVNCNNENVTLTCENDISNEYYRIIKILYCCCNFDVMDCYLNVRCSCGSCDQIMMLGGAENTYLTVYECVEYLRFTYDVDVYMKQSSNNSQLQESETMPNASVSQMNVEFHGDDEYVYNSDFPFFPDEDRPYVSHFNRLVTIVEAWVCQQGFFDKKYYTIPDGICRHEICETKEKKRISLPFRTFFCNVCTVKDEIFDVLFFDMSAKALTAIYSFYTEVLEILQSLGGIVNHIKPESLLSYDTYVTYMRKHRKYTHKIYDRKRFHLWSKLAWLHLILQTYKVFVLKRLIKVNQTGRHEYSLIRTVKSMHNISSMHSIACLPMLSQANIYQTELSFIINWVNTDYNMTKVKFTNKRFINHSELPQRKVEFFDDIFADGTILAAITLTYCPYLEEQFYTLYLPPTTPQQYHYNAYLLIKTWNMLNISLHLKPSDIIECNSLTLIFLLTYLYDFLTHFKPRKEIQISAELTKSNHVEVVVVNENKLPINYELSIFNNSRQLFRVNEHKITVQQNRSVKLLVYYVARFIHSSQAVLVLKGEVGASKYTHGQAFILKGNTVLGPPYLRMRMQSDIYTMVNKDLEFTAPYRQDCQYELFLTYEKPQNFKDLKLLPVKDIIESRTLARMQLDTPYFVATHRQIYKRFRLCSITLTPFRVWIFARHANVGDFYLSMECTVRPRHHIITLVLEVSSDAFSNPCICNGRPKFESKCPRIYTLKLPCKNEWLWKGLLKYFFKYRDKDEYQFWNYYKDTPVALHVLKRLLFDHQKFVAADMSYIFEPRFHFEVKNSSTKSVYMEKKLSIENTLSIDQHTDVLIHFNDFVSNFEFELINSMEERYYNVYIDTSDGLGEI